jgi:hypothetical protein
MSSKNTRNGLPWEPEENAQLEKEVIDRISLEKIASEHQRSSHAIKCRIAKLINEGRLRGTVEKDYNLPEIPTTIYILELENGKFYVGRTDDFQTRIIQHQEGTGCAWTSLFKYKDVIQVFQGDKFDEDKNTLKYMNKYGIENVRGGAYSNIELSFEQYLALQRQLHNANNFCLACGQPGHFINDCCTQICYRCGRIGHMAGECTEVNHILNGKLNGCTRCGRPDHWYYTCNRSKDIYGRKLVQTSCVIS